MAGTKITVKQIVVKSGGQAVVPHVKDGFVQVFEADYLSAGSGEAEYSVLYAVVEPLTKEEEREQERLAAEGRAE